VTPIPYKCTCGGTLYYYNIGFDDGYQCDRCKHIYEFHELEELKKHYVGWMDHLRELFSMGAKHEV